jgi:hypothetical protein
MGTVIDRAQALGWIDELLGGRSTERKRLAEVLRAGR